MHLGCVYVLVAEEQDTRLVHQFVSHLHSTKLSCFCPVLQLPLAGMQTFLQSSECLCWGWKWRTHNCQWQ